MRRSYSATLLVFLGILAGCRTGLNHVDLGGPRYAGIGAGGTWTGNGDTLRVVSFNIKYAREVDSALVVLTAEPALRDADIILLQEMDEAGTDRIAYALGMSYVYYPATFHLRTRRHFGNAVLSRWPIVEDSKLLLPHIARFTRTRRIATAATIRVDGELVRVYSVHLGTIADIGPGAHRDQLSTVRADAARYARVLLGGDLNDQGVGRVAQQSGYVWATEHGPRTAVVGRFDHIFMKGLSSPDSAAAGTVLEVRHASDHRPVWAVGVIPSQPTLQPR